MTHPRRSNPDIQTPVRENDGAEASRRPSGERPVAARGGVRYADDALVAKAIKRIARDHVELMTALSK